MSKRRYLKRRALTFLIFFSICIYTLFPAVVKRAKAQNWTALPPYNTLWPLWSSTLSPVDAASGLPVPLVSSLTQTTVLPVQPGLTWHPSLNNPWLLYNTPLGMAYYDPIGGIDLWPPNILVNQITGLPITLTLAAGYTALLPTPVWWILRNVAPANWTYLVSYPSYSTALPSATSILPQPTITSLLTGIALLL